jgi:hypothetical protein
VLSGEFLVLISRFSSKLPSPIPFAESMLLIKPPFAILTRYYVYSNVTGAHHLFMFGSKTVPEPKMWFPMLRVQPQFVRTDTSKYLRWYFDFAYETVGLPKPDWRVLKPFDLFRVMRTFWHYEFGPQETVVVCLEIQQRWLFVQLKEIFL